MFIDDLGPKAAVRGEPAPRYTDEILCANWNPAIRLAGAVNQNERRPRQRQPEDAMTIDVDAFLDRLYALAI
ncbi:MAG TPA: hypothetical protein VKF40_05380 [Burkholderiales bacterium]|nr:hypothetical protein [Burkholderiales bacterium]